MTGIISVLHYLVACVTLIAVAGAHGQLSQITVGQKVYQGPEELWHDKPRHHEIETPSWIAYNYDSGYVDANSYRNNAITCHVGARPGSVSIPIKAGSAITITWSRWLQGHHGPVLNYLARCPGPCTDAVSADLDFFKIDHDGMYNGTLLAAGLPNFWATDKLIEQNFSWITSLPSSIAPGHYVLRHELISLHQAFELGGAQHYPMCINLEITSDGNVNPCTAGADCRKGTALYEATDPGILIHIYEDLKSYTVPGPAVWSS